jgi:g-D-glutamyl-meso-diaminopimelate peptidase
VSETLYSYNDLLDDCADAERRGAAIGYIGSTPSGRMIPYIRVGAPPCRAVLVQGAIHAREHITAALVAGLMRRALGGGSDFNSIENNPDGGGSGLNGIENNPDGVCVYFIPMSNPDGVSLCQYGLASVRDAGRRQFLRGVNGGEDFTSWKANAAAVDLNCNFPARWGLGAGNLTAHAPASYIGAAAASEPETRALMNFTRAVRPFLTLSYHARGREIYWQFGQKGAAAARDRRIARRLAESTGYAAVDGDGGSTGGYKDWCIAALHVPAFTLETFDGGVPFPIDYALLEAEELRHADVLRVAVKSY